MTHLAIALRGFGIVFVTAANVLQVSHGHYGGALVGGFLISFLWWTNSYMAKTHVPGASFAYAAGAALGTVSGMWVTAWFYAA